MNVTITQPLWEWLVVENPRHRHFAQWSGFDICSAHVGQGEIPDRICKTLDNELAAGIAWQLAWRDVLDLESLANAPQRHHNLQISEPALPEQELLASRSPLSVRACFPPLEILTRFFSGFMNSSTLTDRPTSADTLPL